MKGIKWQSQEKHPPDSSKRQAKAALSSHFGVTPAGRGSLESQPFQSTRGKEQLCGAMTLSCPLLPWLVLKGLFRSVTDGRDLYVQPVLSSPTSPSPGRNQPGRPGTAASPSTSWLSVGWKNPPSYLPPFLEAKGIRGNAENPLHGCDFFGDIKASL